jgi:hypothetical protein
MKGRIFAAADGGVEIALETETPNEAWALKQFIDQSRTRSVDCDGYLLALPNAQQPEPEPSTIRIHVAGSEGKERASDGGNG